MKKFKEFFIVMISIIIFSSCGSIYEEGESKASASFELMTVQEKSLYDAVKEEWGHSRLTSVRIAVHNRELSPDEKSIPFVDIANVIITNNNITLKLNESWATSTKNRYIKARWNKLDQNWFRELLKLNNITDFKPQELIPEEEVIKETIPVRIVEVVNTVKLPSIKNIEGYV